MSHGWFIPPPSQPIKSEETLRHERDAKVRELERRGLLRSERLCDAMLTVRREDFIPSRYRDHAYAEVPLPLPGERATISCPHSYPLFYEPLGLAHGHRFLEIGVGSGYGTALAREVVGREGRVVAIEIDAETLEFATENLERAGHTDVVLIHGDGGFGDPEHAPYDRICVTAACPDVAPPLIEQLAPGGRLIAPIFDGPRQRLTLLAMKDGAVSPAHDHRGRAVRVTPGALRRLPRCALLTSRSSGRRWPQVLAAVARAKPAGAGSVTDRARRC
jgi:protein-L-isoaspartate(D-aspartate) O-methyltransferase